MTTYSAPAGKPLAGGRTIYPHALLDLLAAAADGAWISPSLNTFESVWVPSVLRSPDGGGVSDPTAIIRAWSSFAWDHRHHRMICYGGGHANSSSNEVYLWDAGSLSWQLAFYPSDYTVVTSAEYDPIDGALNTPVSAHTYDGQQYAPILDLFVHFGGAAYNTGGPPVIRDAAGVVLRSVGCHTLSLALAGKGFVGGTTGSNPHRAEYASVDLFGARAWKVRDWLLDHAAKTSLETNFGSRVMGLSAYREENGHDVLYQTGRSSTARSLYRFELVDRDYHNDIITRVGRPWDGPTGQGAGALDPVNDVFLVLGSAAVDKVLWGWDLKYAADTNKNFNVANAGITGADAAEFLALDHKDMGLDYDPVRGHFVAWHRGGAIWTITTPAGDPTPLTGWAVAKLRGDTPTPIPLTAAEYYVGVEGFDRGVLGKWKYAPDLDAFVGLQHSREGHVWIWKPYGWTDPRS